MFRFVLLLCLALPIPLAAQQPDSSSFANFHTQRAALDRRGLRVLGAWGAANVAVSGARYFATEGQEKYFHQMNAGWGAVNLALAGAGLLAARRPTSANRPAAVRAQLRTETLYLFNAGLDAAYLATGLYLHERARTRATAVQQHRLRGYGRSLLLQGGFLLAFDGLMYAAHHRHGRRGLEPLLSHVALGPGSVAVVWEVR